MPDGITSARIDQPPEQRFARLRAPLGVGSFGINVLTFAPGERNRIHRHRLQEEVYVVLEGTLTLLVEGEPIEYVVGDVVRVAPEVRRQLVNRGPGALRLLALGGTIGHEHEPRDAEAFGAWDETEPGTPQTVPVPENLPASELA
ncbi:MAG TPA: cupin domain-containing protein [Solirubrobacteraceae bacterium]|jgi:quercetin dioxygenase-like cupin family protein|nr:cupin domain-containing protein [Solirubrobacteraceae bacterium]